MADDTGLGEIMDSLDFLDAPEGVNDVVQPEAVVEAPVEATPEPTPEPEAPAQETAEEARARDERGRFAPKEKEPVMVPLQALHETRDELKALKAQLAAMQPAQEPQHMPDPDLEPGAFATHQSQQLEQRIYQTNLQWSERIATIQHGPEITKQATDWGYQRCATDPYFNAKVAASADPIGLVVSEYKREQIASNIDDTKYQQFLAWQKAQEQVAAAPAVQPTPTPPRSIATAPSAGGAAHVPVGAGVAFGDVFRG